MQAQATKSETVYQFSSDLKKMVILLLLVVFDLLVVFTVIHVLCLTS